MTPLDSPDASEHGRLPELVAVERDTYVFVALLERPSLDGPSGRLRQTFRVDPTDGDPGEAVVVVTERYDTDGRADHVGFEDQYTIEVTVDETACPSRAEAIRRALERRYVTCEGCGRRYTARIVDDSVVVLTLGDDGDRDREACPGSVHTVETRR